MTDPADASARDRHARALTVLGEALARQGADRHAYVQEACAGDEALRAEVLDLLRYDADANEHDLRPGAGAGLLHEVAAGDVVGPGAREQATATGQSVEGGDLQAGDQLGPYTLIEQVGEGGFGTVFAAEQSQPVRRRVALKVLKAGMDTKEVLARFEAERNALSLLNHPGIARVLDAGATPGGRPYFAMEYIEGIPITDFCDGEQLDIEARLRLFIKVCEAVQHAHQAGIIHRDLKPSNILVMMQDGRAQPKVIDFGIAKATTQPLGDQAIFTLQGQLIGTPEYMSPEQAEMSGVGVDSTTDIYALGVLLYELLTGLLPFDTRTLRSQGVAGIHRFLAETEAARPSTRVRSVDATTTTIGARRGVDVRSLRRDLQGDLDWIVMRAMEKQRTRRYASASELAADVQRHLEHEPVLAGPPSASYRARKFVRRHRVGVAFAAMALVLLVGGIVATGLALLEADRERDTAREAQQLAETAQGEAEAEGARARAVTDFLLDTLGLANPDVTELPEMSMRLALDAAAAQVGEVFADYPQNEAEIRVVIGRAYDTLGRPDLALTHLRRARYLHQHVLHSDAPERMATLVALFPVAERMGDRSWVSIGYELVALGASVIAREEPDLAQAFVSQLTQANDLSVPAGHVREQWDELRRQMAEPGRRTGLGPALEHSMLVSIPVQLGWRSFSIDAPQMIEELLAGMTQRATHDAVRRTTEYALFFRIRAGDFAGARALAESMIDRLSAVLSPEHWYLEIYRSVIGECLVEEGRYDEARPILERSLAVFEGSVAPDLGAAADVHLRLALLHEATGRADLAAPHRQALVDYALEQVHGIQWSMLRTFLEPRFAETVAAFDAFDELLRSTGESELPLSARAGQFADLALAVAEACLADAPDEDPAGMLLATQLATRADILIEAGLVGSATRRLMEQALHRASLRPGQRPLVQITIAAGWLELLHASGDAASARHFAPTVDALVAKHLGGAGAFDTLSLECNAVIQALVRRPGLADSTYDTVARLAVRSLLGVPDKHEFLTTVGAALLRAERNGEALEQLAEADRLAPADAGLASRQALGFLTMAHHRLGHASEAAEALARLGAAVGAAGPFAGAADRALLAEAEALLAD